MNLAAWTRPHPF